jgi:tetratricopeptide (TPR) repeat protein
MVKAATDPLAAMVGECRRLMAMQNYSEAEALCRQMLSMNGAHPDALHLLGLIAYRAHLYDESAALIRRAIAARRGDPEFHNNLGLALQAGGDLADAVKSFGRAVAARPDIAVFHSNLGNGQKDLGEIKSALTSFRRAIALEPELASAHFGRALCLLLLGEIHEAWREYEWRVAFERGTPYISDPRGGGDILRRPSQLVGEDLRGKRILVLKEQGLGDELFFLRSAPELRLRGAWLAYSGSANILPMLRRSDVVDLLIESGGPLPASDHTLLVGDLPLLAATENADSALPPALPLTAQPAALEKARAIARDSGPAPYLAVTWRAGIEARRGQGRTLTKSIPINELSCAVARWPGTVLVVQRNPRPEELADFRRVSGLPMGDLSAANDDLDLMLGVMDVADEYVGVSNTNMHLRAGLSRRARVLVPSPAEWRWTLDHERSPWFPEFSLYRQDLRSGWSPAFRQLATDLQDRRI